MLHPIISLIIFYIYAFTLKKARLLTKILSPIVFMIVLILIDTVVVFLFNALLNANFSVIIAGNNLIRYLFLLTVKLLLGIVLSIIVKIFSIDEHFSLYELILYLFFPVITLFTLYVFVELSINYDISKYAVHICVVVLGVALFNILSILLLKKTVQNTSAKFELELLESRRELEEERYRELGAIYSKLRVTRHDIREHLMYINCLMEDHQYDEVNKYILDKQSELEKTKRFYHTGNRMADFILDSKVTQNEDISFEISGSLGELEGVDELDITSLLGNILNNAIEGVANAENKKIELIFRTQGEYINITCKNTVVASVLNTNPDLRSSKADKSNHGFGVKSIKNTIEKYNGMLEFYEDGGMFCVHCAIRI